MFDFIDTQSPERLATLLPVAIGLAMARWLGLALVMPVFSRTGVATLTKGGFAFAMAVPAIGQAYMAVLAAEPSRAFIDIPLLVGKELMVGFALGLILGVPFWGAEMAGEALDVQRGTAAGTLADPTGSNQASVLGTFFAITTVALFLASGGIRVIVSVVTDSYALWPVASLGPAMPLGWETILLGLLGRLMLVAIVLAAPIVLAALLTDVFLGFIGKLAPQLNTHLMGAALKSLVLSVFLVLYAQVFSLDLLNATLGLKETIPALEATGR